MSGILTGTRIAILATDGVERVELTEPRRALEAAGAEGGPAGTECQIDPDDGPPGQEPESARRPQGVPGRPRRVRRSVLPGGVVNADKLRIDQESVRFTRAPGYRHADRRDLPRAMDLIETGLLRGRVSTSYPTLRTDLRNAGARWVDEEVHNDNGLVSSRRPADLPAFNSKIIEEFAEGSHLRKIA